MYHIFLIHSSVNAHLDCFYILAILTSATMNTRVQIIVAVWIYAQEWDCWILCQHLLLSDILLLANLMSWKRHFIVVFSEHFLIISSCISFLCITVQGLCPFLIRFILLFLCLSSNPLSDMGFVDIFSLSVGCFLLC